MGLKFASLLPSNLFEPMCYVALPAKAYRARNAGAQCVPPPNKNQCLIQFIRWIKNGQLNQIGTGARLRAERNDASLHEPLCFMHP